MLYIKKIESFKLKLFKLWVWEMDEQSNGIQQILLDDCIGVSWPR